MDYWTGLLGTRPGATTKRSKTTKKRSKTTTRRHKNTRKGHDAITKRHKITTSNTSRCKNSMLVTILTSPQLPLHIHLICQTPTSLKEHKYSHVSRQKANPCSATTLCHSRVKCHQTYVSQHCRNSFITLSPRKVDKEGIQGCFQP